MNRNRIIHMVCILVSSIAWAAVMKENLVMVYYISVYYFKTVALESRNLNDIFRDVDKLSNLVVVKLIKLILLKLACTLSA